MESKGYVLIGVTPGLDLFWGRRDLFDPKCFDVPTFEEYVPLMQLTLLVHTRQNNLGFLDKLVDTKVWKDTGDIQMAKNVAKEKLEKHMLSDSVISCLSGVKPSGASNPGCAHKGRTHDTSDYIQCFNHGAKNGKSSATITDQRCL